MKKWVIYLVIGLCFSCGDEEVTQPEDALPKGFPSALIPPDNNYTQARFDLGKKLFYDPILSRDSSLSCASCHKPDFAFSDNNATTSGIFGRAGTRNVPSLANVVYQPYLLREGSLPTIEMQVLVPIQEHNEFDNNMPEIVARLNKSTEYNIMSLKAYDRKPDAFVVTRALANFQRELISGSSKYDEYRNGKISSLNASEKKGMDLFFSNKTNCSSCHEGVLFTNFAFENNGLYENYNDIGRKRFTDKPEDEGRFKTPSLRNAALTAPYMHNGSINSLNEVIEHYNSGGKNHPNKSSLIRPLYLTNEEKQNLVDFLITLSDPRFINNKRFRQ